MIFQKYCCNPDKGEYRSYADPAGHPFCLYRDAAEGDHAGRPLPGRIGRVVFDCFSPRALAAFYEELLGMRTRKQDLQDRVVIARDDGSLPMLAFQHAQFKAPRWPDPAYPQQLHLDLHFDDGGPHRSWRRGWAQSACRRVGAVRYTPIPPPTRSASARRANESRGCWPGTRPSLLPAVTPSDTMREGGHKMPYYMYVCLQDDDKIVAFTMDAETGQLTPKAEVLASGGPSLLAISPDRNVLYVGHRVRPEISSFRIDPDTGGLTHHGTVSPAHAPTFLATDRTGRYLLSAYYQGGYAAVHPLGEDGAVGDPPIDWLATATGAHAIQTDPSNKFAFVPHIARLNDNVLEPVREASGPNVILQFRFDEHTGHLTPNAPFRVEPEVRLGPRHYCFHPTQDLVYFSNEQGCSVTGYRLDPATGTLAAFQTITTLPDGYTARNTCSQIQIASSGKFLYVPNRGHNSIAGFSVDASTGRLTAIGHVSTEAVPSAFSLDPEGHFVFAAGSASGRLAAYRINGETGELTPLETYAVGQRPMWVLVTRLGD